MLITLGLLGAACTSSSAHPASGATTSSADRSPAALASEGLVVPDTYQEACANFNLACMRGTTGQIPDGLKGTSAST